MKERVERRIKRLTDKVATLKEKYGDDPSKAYYGCLSLGYWEGKLSMYEGVLNALNEEEDE